MTTAAVDEFWQWWTTSGRDRAVQATHGGEPGLWDTLGPEVTERIERIDPGLDWETDAGVTAWWMLLVTGPAAARQAWLRAAPEPDELWEYAASRPADPGAMGTTVVVGDTAVAVAEIRFEVLPGSYLRVWHPAFTTAPAETRRQIAGLALDWLLGEDTADTRISGYETAPLAEPGLPGDELHALITRTLGV